MATDLKPHPHCAPRCAPSTPTSTPASPRHTYGRRPPETLPKCQSSSDQGSLARVLGEAAVGASRTDTFLGERYRRIARRRGKKKAIVAVGRSILVIIWHLLSNPDTAFHDLGSDFYDNRRGPPQRRTRAHVRQLEALGYKRSPSNPQPDPPTRPTPARTPHHAEPVIPFARPDVTFGLDPEVSSRARATEASSA